MSRLKLRTLGYLLVIVLTGAAVGLFMLFGPPRLLAKSETPDFCVSCHVMEAEYEAWRHEGAHRGINCVDCHLPHQNATLHYTWKSIDGLKDMVVFYSGTVPEFIKASDHAVKVVQSNCIRCHESLVEKIDNERRCWRCHRRLVHVSSGAIQTQ